MSDMVRLTPEQHEELAQQMRLANTARIKGVIDSLEPYVDGSAGAINPGHVTAYLKAVRELGLLWHAYDKPAGSDEGGLDEGGELAVFEERQAKILAELRKLREVGMKGRG